MANTKVQSEQIEDGSITADKIADGAIVATELASNSVTTAKITADAVTGAKIADDAIDSEHYVDGSIDTAHIGNDQVTQAKIADDAVGADQLAASAVVTASIVDDNVTTAKIADGNISTALLADTAVTSAKLANNIDIAGTFDVTGATTLDSSLSVAGDLDIADTGAGAITVGGTTNTYSAPVVLNVTDIGLAMSDGTKTLATWATHGGSSHAGSGIGTRSNHDLAILTNDTKIMVFDTSGNVGIGTTSPTRTLDINHASTAPDLRLGCDGNDRSLIILDADRSTEADPLGTIVWRWNNTDTAAIESRAGADTTNKDDGGLTFMTRTSGSALADAMTITSGGTIGMGAGSGNFAGSILINNDGGTGTLSNAYYNTGFGWEVFDDLTTGDSNTAIGNQAGYKLTEGTGNTMIGRLAGETLTSGSYNTAIGYNTMGDGTVTADGNTCVGNSVGVAITSGARNTAMGQSSLQTNNSGNYNVAIGDSTLQYNTNGGENVMVGFLAGNQNGINTTNIHYNTGLGSRALYTNASAPRNTAVGAYALHIVLSGDGKNTAVGYDAGGQITTGHSNIAIGDDSADGLSTGSANIQIGTGTNPDNTSNYQIAIGHGLVGLGGNSFTLGKDNGNDRVYNVFTSNASWTRVSDERYKENITPNTDCGLAFINDLNPVTFNWKAKADIDSDLPDYDKTQTEPEYDKKLYGLVAQEVKATLDKHSITDFGGWSVEEKTGIQAISQEMFVHPLIKAVQELSTKLDAAEARIKTLEDS